MLFCDLIYSKELHDNQPRPQGPLHFSAILKLVEKKALGPGGMRAQLCLVPRPQYFAAVIRLENVTEIN